MSVIIKTQGLGKQVEAPEGQLRILHNISMQVAAGNGIKLRKNVI